MRISKLRRERGLSQRQLAKELGYHPSAIAQVEAGHRRAWPKLKRRIGEFFEVNWRELEQ